MGMRAYEFIVGMALFHHWKEKSISLGGKSIPLPLVGRAAPCDWWKGISLPLVGRALHCHLAGGASYCHWWEGHPIAFGGKGMPVAFQEDAAGLSSGYSNDIIGMV